MIYILKSNGCYKIGYTESFEDREKAYKTHNPDYRLVYLFEGGTKEDEKSLHKEFREFKLKDRQEWFRLPEEVEREFLQSMSIRLLKYTFQLDFEPSDDEIREVYSSVTIKRPIREYSSRPDYSFRTSNNKLYVYTEGALYEATNVINIRHLYEDYNEDDIYRAGILIDIKTEDKTYKDILIYNKRDRRLNLRSQHIDMMGHLRISEKANITVYK